MTTLTLRYTAAPGANPEIRATRNVVPILLVAPVVRPREEEVVEPKHPKYITPWELARQTETARLTNRISLGGVEKHCLSPQASADREAMGSQILDHDPDRNSRRTNNKGGWIRRNRGKKPVYKDRNMRAQGSVLARAVNAVF